MRVRIDAGGRQVEIECSDTNVSPKDVVEQALEAWRSTEGAAKGTAGPALGFSGQLRPDGEGFNRRMGEVPTPVRADREAP
jgi:hypothetical protein